MRVVLMLLPPMQWLKKWQQSASMDVHPGSIIVKQEGLHFVLLICRSSSRQLQDSHNQFRWYSAAVETRGCGPMQVERCKMQHEVEESYSLVNSSILFLILSEMQVALIFGKIILSSEHVNLRHSFHYLEVENSQQPSIQSIKSCGIQ